MQLVAEEVSHTYEPGTPEVLRKVSLAVAAGGETVALVGPSGSGKTTLLSILGGLLEPTEGVVVVKKDEGRSLDILSVTSWIHQTAHGLGHRTVFDNVLLGILSSGGRRQGADATVERCLSTVGLTHRIDANARTLSGGELQRMAIARVLVAKPSFVLADEPTGQLDRATSTRVLEALFHRDAATSIIVATHDPTVADLCDRVLVCDSGRVTTKR